MPDLPWTARAGLDPAGRYVVMASHLPLRRLSSTARFLRAVSEIRRQLGRSEGLVGYTLRARPLARDYWTLSVWRDEPALREFMRSPPHVEWMSSLKQIMGPTTFIQWEINGDEGRPDWSSALSRLSIR